MCVLVTLIASKITNYCLFVLICEWNDGPNQRSSRVNSGHGPLFGSSGLIKGPMCWLWLSADSCVFLQHIWTHLRRINLRSSSWSETHRPAPWLYWSTSSRVRPPDLTSGQTGSEPRLRSVFLLQNINRLQQLSAVTAQELSVPCRRDLSSKRRRCRSLNSTATGLLSGQSMSGCVSSAVPVYVCGSSHETDP